MYPGGLHEHPKSQYPARHNLWNNASSPLFPSPPRQGMLRGIPGMPYQACSEWDRSFWRVKDRSHPKGLIPSRCQAHPWNKVLTRYVPQSAKTWQHHYSNMSCDKYPKTGWPSPVLGRGAAFRSRLSSTKKQKKSIFCAQFSCRMKRESVKRRSSMKKNDKWGKKQKNACTLWTTKNEGTCTPVGWLTPVATAGCAESRWVRVWTRRKKKKKRERKSKQARKQATNRTSKKTKKPAVHVGCHPLYPSLLPRGYHTGATACVLGGGGD